MKHGIFRGLSILGVFALGVVAQSKQVYALCRVGVNGGREWLQNECGLPSGSILGIVATTMAWLLAILGFLAIIGFIIAGFFYLLAAGDEKQAAIAKNGLKYSIYGIITALLGYIIIQAATTMLNAQGGF
jgi:hypothetical protein